MPHSPDRWRKKEETRPPGSVRRAHGEGRGRPTPCLGHCNSPHSRVGREESAEARTPPLPKGRKEGAPLNS